MIIYNGNCKLCDDGHETHQHDNGTWYRNRRKRLPPANRSLSDKVEEIEK